jgi:hypothetical protein
VPCLTDILDGVTQISADAEEEFLARENEPQSTASSEETQNLINEWRSAVNASRRYSAPKLDRNVDACSHSHSIPRGHSPPECGYIPALSAGFPGGMSPRALQPRVQPAVYVPVTSSPYDVQQIGHPNPQTGAARQLSSSDPPAALNHLEEATQLPSRFSSPTPASPPPYIPDSPTIGTDSAGPDISRQNLPSSVSLPSIDSWLLHSHVAYNTGNRRYRDEDDDTDNEEAHRAKRNRFL